MIHSKTTFISFLLALFLISLFAACGLDGKKTAPTNAKGTGESTIPDEVDDWDTLGGPSGNSGPSLSGVLSDLRTPAAQEELKDLFGEEGFQDLMGGLNSLNNASTPQEISQSLNGLMGLIQEFSKKADSQTQQQFAQLLHDISKDIESQKKNPQSTKSFIQKIMGRIVGFLKSIIGGGA